MKKPEIGGYFRIIGNCSRDGYEPSISYRIVRVDYNDRTLLGAHPNGDERRWISWDHVRLLEEIGWDWLRQMLPTEAVKLLCAFEGLESLRLREDVRVQILQTTNHLREVFLDATTAIDEAERRRAEAAQIQ